MIPAAILAFLIGTVLAWRFRVWILLPVTLVAFVSMTAFQVWESESVQTALKLSLLPALAPQIGYCFGLLARAFRSSPSQASAATMRPVDKTILG